MTDPKKVIAACLKLDDVEAKLKTRIVPEKDNEDLEVAIQCVQFIRAMMTPSTSKKEGGKRCKL